MNPINNQSRLVNNTFSIPNKQFLKKKIDTVKENHSITSQKYYLNPNNYEKIDYSINKKSCTKSQNLTNNQIGNKKMIYTNNVPNNDKSLNLTNNQDIVRNFSGNKIKKSEIANVSILSPKTQKEILSNKINNINSNENLFQKNVNLDIDNQIFNESNN